MEVADQSDVPENLKWMQGEPGTFIILSDQKRRLTKQPGTGD